MQDGLTTLERLLDPYEWFVEVGIEKNQYVVYVHFLNNEILGIIPENMCGHRVLVHYAASKTEKYANPDDHEAFPLVNRIYDVSDEAIEVVELPSDVLEDDLSKLRDELIRLEKICGFEVLIHIFYERHDLDNAVTNHSSKYPNVRATMNELYNTYGFENIYDILET